MMYRFGREIAGVFHDASGFEAAIDDLLLAGFDRSLVSLMADEATVERALGHIFASSGAVVDDPAVPRIPFIGMRSRGTLRAMAISTLGSAGICAIAGGVAASGGTVALALALGAAVGGASGAVAVALGRIMQRRYARSLLWQLERGGILLWVATPTLEQEQAAAAIIRRHGADHVHAHELPVVEASRHGGVSERLAWINKPLVAPRASAGGLSRAERSTTVH
ncbi:MAG TPA: hypothetical protein VLX09_19150 [Stellaceae bacterium]|nr:hypothetical protein [Stellaceae bacterium]